jgi:hypothetical protein
MPTGRLGTTVIVALGIEVAITVDNIPFPELLNQIVILFKPLSVFITIKEVLKKL